MVGGSTDTWAIQNWTVNSSGPVGGKVTRRIRRVVSEGSLVEAFPEYVVIVSLVVFASVQARVSLRSTDKGKSGRSMIMDTPGRPQKHR